MKTLLIIFLSFVASNTFAQDFLNDEALANLNLVGMQLINKEMNANSFNYKLKKAASDQQLAVTLEEASRSEIVSPVYELNQNSAFKNIYVYVGKKEDGVYELVTFYLNKSGSHFVVDMDFVSANQKSAELVHGAEGDETYYQLKAAGNLFP